MKKVVTIGIVVILILAAAIFWWRHYFVFGEGVKAGDLNFLVKKGYHESGSFGISQTAANSKVCLCERLLRRALRSSQ